MSNKIEDAEKTVAYVASEYVDDRAEIEDLVRAVGVLRKEKERHEAVLSVFPQIQNILSQLNEVSVALCDAGSYQFGSELDSLAVAIEDVTDKHIAGGSHG